MSVLPDYWIQTLGWTLVHSLWILTILALGLRLLLWFIPRRSARGRYGVAVAGFALALITLPYTGYRVQQSEATSSLASAITAYSVEATPGPQAATTAPASYSAAQVMQQLQRGLQPQLSGILVLWFSGVLFFFLRTCGKIIYLRRLTRVDTYPFPEEWATSVARLKQAIGIRRDIRLIVTSRIRTPFVVGLVKPVILLPLTSCSQLSYEQLEAILAHELAHIRRWDDVVNWLQSAGEILLFYHPAIWWISQTIRDEREKCCDDLAVAACGDALVYAKALAQMESLQQSLADVVLAFAAHRGAGLLARIERLLQPATSPSRSPAAPTLVTGLLLLSFFFSYRLTTSVSPSSSRPHSSYSSAIISIPGVPDPERGSWPTQSPWQPELPSWLKDAEVSALDTVPDTTTHPDTVEQNSFQFHFAPDTPFSVWGAESDTLHLLLGLLGDSLGRFAVPDMPDPPVVIDLDDFGSNWLIDSALQLQLEDIRIDTIFPPADFAEPLKIPGPPMPDTVVIPDSVWSNHWLHYEQAGKKYAEIVDRLDSTGYWDRFTEVFEHLDSIGSWNHFTDERSWEEYQKQLESRLRDQEARQEQQLREWEQRREQWGRRQEEQLERYQERRQEQLQRQQESQREQQRRQQERQQSQLQRYEEAQRAFRQQQKIQQLEQEKQLQQEQRRLNELQQEQQQRQRELQKKLQLQQYEQARRANQQQREILRLQQEKLREGRKSDRQ